MKNLAKQSNRTVPRNRGKELAWACIPSLALALGGLAVSANAHLAPTDLQTVTAIFPPWWEADRAFISAASTGAVVAVGPAPFVVTVHDSGFNLPERLRAVGAAAVINPSKAPFCGARTARQ